MTREETKKIIRIMCDSYPNYKPMDLSETVDVWTMMLEEYTYEQISVALKAYVLSDTSGFAPSVGQLVAKVQTITQPQELNEMEAWALVARAIRSSTYYFEEEYAKLPPTIQRAVGLPSQLKEWAITENLNVEVAMSQFVRAYRTEVSRKNEFQKLPSDVQRITQNISTNSHKAQIQSKRNLLIKSLSRTEKALEMACEGIEMPERLKGKVEMMKNENAKKIK